MVYRCDHIVLGGKQLGLAFRGRVAPIQLLWNPFADMSRTQGRMRVNTFTYRLSMYYIV